ncbi:MAG TPA: MobC family plasmid mobilization relaxosome protein [Flammeovirgaceae bacterium]|nr:MobC family plasmid mobilization relaxosome protein [Flammeovirgaceae bacterium]
MTKLGRKKLPGGDKRKHTIACRLTDSELEVLLSQKPAKMSKGEFLRQLALSRQVTIQKIPRVNQAVRTDLGRIGNNINQIARALNSGLDVRVANLSQAIAGLQAQLAAIRQELAR